MRSKIESTFQWDVFLVWMLVFVYVFTFWFGVYSVCFAESTDIKEIKNGDIKVVFDPSPDKRATGHKLYWTNNVTSDGKVVDLKDQTDYIILKGILGDNTVYKFTATAYGMITDETGKLVEAESVHSEPYYARIVPDESDTEWPVYKKPESPTIIEIRWQ
jgi:hypothetical protein